MIRSPLRPDFQVANVTLYNRDCLEVLPILPTGAAIITDPPYGVKNDADYTRLSGGKHPSNNFHNRTASSPNWGGILGDDKPFDPSPWLRFPKVVLWGYQYFAQRLPLGTVLVWQKNRDSALGKFMSDCELAWMKGGKGTYLFKHIWRGMDRESEQRQKTLHPNQKPVALFDWVLRRAKIKPMQVVVDPYMGSAPCALACIKAGIPFIGIEKDPKHFAKAVARIKARSGTVGANMSPKSKYNLFPDLTTVEYEALKASIADRGVDIPIIVDDEGNIIDGWHRQTGVR